MHFFSLQKRNCKLLNTNNLFSFSTTTLHRFLFSLTFVVYFAASYFVSFSYAQDIRFSAITTAEGLSQNTITALIQDKQGFLWIGTPDGLHRYDGYSLVESKNLPNDSTSLINNSVTALVEDKNGDIWVGTEKGISKWIRNQNTFEQIKFNQIGAIPHTQIQSLFKDDKNNIWVGSKEGLSFYKDDKDEWIHFASNNQKLVALKNLSVAAITQDGKGNIWIGSDSLGLYKIALAQTNEQVTHFDIKNGLLDIHITSLASDTTTNTLWIGTIKGLQALHLDEINNQNEDNTKLFTSFINHQNDIHSISGNHITGLLVDRSGQLWVGTASQGINKYLNTKAGFIRHQKDVYNPFSLSDNTGIKVLFQDRTGVFWFGTAQGGLNKYDPEKIKFRLYRSVNDLRQNGIQDNNITCFFKDDEGKTWIGTKKAGIFRYNPKIANGWFTQYSRYSHGMPSDDVTGITQDLYGTTWCSTRDRGVGRFSYKNGNLTIIQYKKHWEGLPSSRIAKLFTDKKGEIWVLTFEGDLCKYSRALNDFEVKVEGEPNLTDNEIMLSAKSTNKNTIWVGTPTGAYLYDVTTEKIILDKRNDLKVWVSSIEEIGDSSVWFSSSKGLIRYLPQKDSLTYFSRKDGLTTDMIYSVVLGEDKNLWLSTNKGISRFSLKTLKAKSYDETNGLQGQDFLAGSYYKSNEGELFFGGKDGYNAFFPTEIKDDPLTPQIVFTEIDIFSKSLPFIDFITRVENPLDSYILTADSLTLDYEKTGFSLEFAALHFSDPKKNAYAYKMEGLDEEWTYVNAGRRFVNYPTLPYGNYVFRVKAANSDEVWNEEGTALYINVSTPVWERLWFRILGILMIVGIISAFYMARIRRSKNQQKLLELQVEERTKELQEKNKNMTDSLRYAKTIQTAILPPETDLKECLTEVFTVYEPLEIVSGDFYWFKNIDNIVYIAVADCTGHGVPGAFMSMIGSSILSDMVQQNKELKPCETLELLNQKIRTSLSQQDNRNSDGMDICFCKINLKTNQVWFSGAKRPLYITKKDGTFKEIKGDRKSIGGKKRANEKEFTTTEIQLESGDMIYLTSDGYADQPNQIGKKIGSLQLQDLLKNIGSLPAQKQKQEITDMLNVHKGDTKQRDDIAIMGIRM
ncbi:putative periplasmic ligand-binding sensor domain protein [Bernardetia litoralis DSM 6794]|uniref:Putative periplasmic ligand-binding sensor domain protein n=1 Tax=Bernardetia litoralis (strain ATCC 23117 / DSM 6794 / NBRC 15988 / NCIMB 1366 / Fx l1 / Sio-4) TaxID=880071 RepID=I4APL7_BERLS|nr:two-component regulator propeller domain-containing protein [Bernardetia litoralis]AFM05902.1 putative periplasmic ligand-binding sensor domain protein [Bernardetia litoralis DSM 6794]